MEREPPSTHERRRQRLEELARALYAEGDDPGIEMREN
jgi:hypothetical protein